MKVKLIIDLPAEVLGTKETQKYFVFAEFDFRPQIMDILILGDFLDPLVNITTEAVEYIEEVEEFLITEATIRKYNGKTIIECYLEPLAPIVDEDDMLDHLSRNN